MQVRNCSPQLAWESHHVGARQTAGQYVFRSEFTAHKVVYAHVRDLRGFVLVGRRFCGDGKFETERLRRNFGLSVAVLTALTATLTSIAKSTVFFRAGFVNVQLSSFEVGTV